MKEKDVKTKNRLGWIFRFVILIEIIIIILILLHFQNKKMIIFNGNGANSGSMNNVIAYSKDKVDIEENKFVKDGYEFAGWNLYNDKNSTWKCEEGWCTEDEIKENNYKVLSYTTEEVYEYFNQMNKGKITAVAKWSKPTEETERAEITEEPNEEVVAKPNEEIVVQPNEQIPENTENLEDSKSIENTETKVEETKKECKEHVYTSKIIKAASCLENGIKEFSCVNCDNTYTEELVKLEHEYEVKVRKPGCEEDGAKIFTCINCNDTFKEILPRTGHNFETDVFKEATCSEFGILAHICKGCGKIEAENIAKLKHHYVESVKKPATCAENGIIIHKCTECGDIEKIEEIEKLEHHFVEEIEKAATCTETGILIHKCTECGDIEKTEEIAKLEHNYEEIIIKEATKKEEGIKQFICKDCQDSYEEKIEFEIEGETPGGQPGTGPVDPGGNEEEFSYELIKYHEDDSEGGLVITAIFANQYQACIDAIQNWNGSGETPKIPTSVTQEEKENLRKLIKGATFITSGETLETLMPVTCSISSGKYTGEYSEYAEGIGAYVMSGGTWPEEIDDEDFKIEIDNEKEVYQSFIYYMNNIGNSTKEEISGENLIPVTIEGKPVKVIKTIGDYVTITGVLTIPEGVRKIGNASGDQTFRGQNAITKLVLPTSIKRIEQNAFRDCEALETIEADLDEDLWMGANVFSGSSWNLKNLKASTKFINELTFQGQGSKIEKLEITRGEFLSFNTSSENLEELILNEDLKSIGGFMFGTPNLNSIELPKTLKNIGTYAFQSSNIEEIVIPTSVKVIRQGAFSNCQKLREVTFESKDINREENLVPGEDPWVQGYIRPGSDKQACCFELCNNLTMNLPFENAEELNNDTNWIYICKKWYDNGYTLKLKDGNIWSPVQ